MEKVKATISRIVIPVISVLLCLGLNYLFTPAWTLHSAGMWGLLLTGFLIATCLSFIIEFMINEKETSGMVITGIYAGISIVIVLIMCIGNLSGAKAFNSSKYQALIEVQDGNFQEEIPEAEDVAVVDLNTARRVGSRAIGTIKNSTWYEIDNEYNLITYQGKQYRISPLNYGGYLKFRKAKEVGIPGYVLVDAVTQEGKYIALDKPIYYSPSAFWGKDLSRHLRSQYLNYILGTSFFEIDEEGNPFWITSVKTPTIGLFGGKTEEKFIITNANNGESDIYSAEELPKWVDHAFDLKYLMTTTQWSFEYVHGWWNALTSKTDVKNLSYVYGDGSFSGYNSTVTKDGIMFFTGVTPANSTESNVGFILVSTRTGVVKYFECPGAEESSAQAAAEGLVQNLGYKATYPTIINVDGIETYFMTLKDDAGLIQKYALCNVANYTMVVEANTLQECMDKYCVKIGVTKETPKEDTFSKEGTISEITNVQISGYTYYCFKLNGEDDIYMSSIENSSKQAFMKEGQKIRIEFVKSSEEGVFTIKKISF